jgi:hypothetical protein
MRASIRPYVWANLPEVINRPDVYGAPL